ncbi:MAG: hypothetical protein ACFE0Q_01620 [Anaerolineae bacterium]
MIHRFAIKLAVFALPLILVFSFIIIMGLYIGELLPMQYVINQQTHTLTERVYEPTWSDADNIHFKFQSIVMRNPDVLVLGSSRMHFFRSTFINRQPETFYNASIPNLDPYETRRIVDELASRHQLPPIILLGIDPPYFNANTANTIMLENSITDVAPDIVDNFVRFYEDIREVTRMMLLEPDKFRLFLSRRHTNDHIRWGLSTLDTNYGFRNDGSYYLGTDLSSLTRRRIQRHLNAFNDRTWMYSTWTQLEDQAFEQYNTILQVAQAHDSIVIGIVPPYQESMHNSMMASDDFAKLPVAMVHLDTLFASYNMPLHRYEIPQNIGGADNELYDTWHPGEVLSLRIFLDLVNAHPDVFQQYTNVESLETLLTESIDPLYLYGINP